MTQHSISEKSGLGDVPMPSDWKDIRTPQEFAIAAQEIIRSHSGHDAHRVMDRLTFHVLHNLGFGDGADIFAEAAFDWHHPQLVYPLKRGGRLWCKLGLHKFVPDHESPVPWAAPEICVHCNKRNSASLHEICP